MKNIIYTYLLFILCSSCVEMGKPVTKEAEKVDTKSEELVEHFKCPNGHKGSDKQGKCAECDAFFVHNQAYHGKATVNFPPPVINDPNQGNATNANTPPPPAQNAAGAYHYTCPNLHTGGSGTASKCSSCGNQLIHNQDYHK